MQSFFAVVLQDIIFTLMLITAHVSANACKVEECNLDSKLDFFGFDIAKQPIYIDIGECRTTYSPNITLACNDQCTPRCTPQSHDIQLYSDRSGPNNVSTIRSCHATRHHCLQTCQRIRKTYYYFPESKYQTRIDVGACTNAGCQESSDSCEPTKTISKSVLGPNGDITVDIIEECECVSKSCHRVDYWESHWDHITTCGNDSRLRIEKLINVGRCQGDCAGIRLPSRCYPSDENCVLRIPGSQTKCVPLNNKNEVYVNADLKNETVQTILSCGCNSA